MRSSDNGSPLRGPGKQRRRLPLTSMKRLSYAFAGNRHRSGIGGEWKVKAGRRRSRPCHEQALEQTSPRQRRSTSSDKSQVLPLDTDVFIMLLDCRQRRSCADAQELISASLTTGFGIVSSQVIEESLCLQPLNRFHEPLTHPDCRLYLKRSWFHRGASRQRPISRRALDIRERLQQDHRRQVPAPWGCGRHQKDLAGSRVSGGAGSARRGRRRPGCVFGIASSSRPLWRRGVARCSRRGCRIAAGSTRVAFGRSSVQRFFTRNGRSWGLRLSRRLVRAARQGHDGLDDFR